jgi:pimeloyl-ACP methyl ester carboxylesterase
MYRKIPYSKLEFIEGAGHFPHLTHPDKFLYYVIDFLS